MSIFLAFLGNRWGQLIAVVLAGYFYGFYSVPRVDVPAIVRNAEAGRDAHWRDVLREKELENEREIAAAIAERDADQPIADTPNWADELCRKSATCRDKGRSK